MKTYSTETPKGKHTAMKRILSILFILAASSQLTQAQQGFGTSNPAPSSVIDMTATNKGALLPRIALTSTIVAAPVNAPVNALTVFNTATAGDVTPGYYYWSVPQMKWIRLADTNMPSTEPWRIQTTVNSATSNIDKIYQNNKVAIGDFSGAESTKIFEVKGNFKAEVAAGNILFGTEVAHPLVSDGALHYWLDGATGNYRSAAASSASAALESKTSTTTNTISTNATQAAMASVNGTNSLSTSRNTNNGNFYMETYNVANNNGSTLAVGDNGVSLVHTNTNGSLDPFPNNNRTELIVRKAVGIGVDMRNATGTVIANYFLPTTSGTAGQVLTKSTGNNTVWANPVAAPKFFYAPSMVMPTVNADLPSYVTYAGGTFTVDMYAFYSAQFGMTGDVGGAARTAIKSTGAGNLDVIPAASLGYFVTYFDNTVYDPASIALTADGKLSYRILATATVTAKTYMNVVFKQL